MVTADARSTGLPTGSFDLAHARTLLVNWEVMAAACRPPLTTVDMNLRELGRAAAERLLAAIDGQFTAGVEKLPCSLVLRESSRPRAPALIPATEPSG